MGLRPTLKGFFENDDSLFTRQRHYGGGTIRMTSSTGGNLKRKAARNTAFSIHFVIKGAEKRRTMAYAKAKMLQSELGVVPHLVSVK